MKVSICNTATIDKFCNARVHVKDFVREIRDPSCRCGPSSGWPRQARVFFLQNVQVHGDHTAPAGRVRAKVCQTHRRLTLYDRHLRL